MLFILHVFTNTKKKMLVSLFLCHAIKINDVCCVCAFRTSLTIHKEDIECQFYLAPISFSFIFIHPSMNPQTNPHTYTTISFKIDHFHSSSSSLASAKSNFVLDNNPQCHLMFYPLSRVKAK